MMVFECKDLDVQYKILKVSKGNDAKIHKSKRYHEWKFKLSFWDLDFLAQDLKMYDGEPFFSNIT